MDLTRPLTSTALYILLALAERDLHGYAVMQTVREVSGGRVPLRTGSFYRYLSQLIDAGLVAEAAGRRASADPRRGADYRLTARGRQVLESERRHLAGLVAAMDAVRPSTRKGLA
ncbi:MAG TPA: PadR family transcriptional regulator [Vicinamibacterales bacterium]